MRRPIGSSTKGLQPIVFQPIKKMRKLVGSTPADKSSSISSSKSTSKLDRKNTLHH